MATAPTLSFRIHDASGAIELLSFMPSRLVIAGWVGRDDLAGDPVLGRDINHQYTIAVLPIVA
jgi:hypothetical protein